MITQKNITSHVRHAARDGSVMFTQHASDRMRQRGVTPMDVLLVLLEGDEIGTQPPNKLGQNPQTRLQGNVEGVQITVVASIVEQPNGESAIVITTWQ